MDLEKKVYEPLAYSLALDDSRKREQTVTNRCSSQLIGLLMFKTGNSSARRPKWSIDWLILPNFLEVCSDFIDVG